MAEKNTARPKLVVCGHCSERVSKRTYYEHRRLYYDVRICEWKSKRVFNQTAYDEVFSIENCGSRDLSSNDPLCRSKDRSRSSSPSPNQEATEYDELAVSDVESEEDDVISEDDDEEDDVQVNVLEEIEAYDDDPDLFDLTVCHQQNTDKTEKYSAIVQLYLFFLFMFQTIFKISDTALNTLLKFLFLFMRTVAQKVVAIPLDALPDGIRTARKCSGQEHQFTKFVCCPSCKSLYSRNECIVETRNQKSESKRCSYVKFPNHPQVQHRNEILLIEVRLRNGRVMFYPRHLYCYQSIIQSLQEMPSFFDKCELWRERASSDGVYSDIYDGVVWKNFLAPNGNPFLTLPGNYAFQLNVDWFNPFKHTQHSEGAIY